MLAIQMGFPLQTSIFPTLSHIFVYVFNDAESRNSYSKRYYLVQMVRNNLEQDNAVAGMYGSQPQCRSLPAGGLLEPDGPWVPTLGPFPPAPPTCFLNDMYLNPL